MAPKIKLDLKNFSAKATTWIDIPARALKDTFFYEAIHLWPTTGVAFLTSDTDLDDDTDDDTGWKPIRLLGEGGFGLVGLWQKFASDNRVIDSIAIKQQRRGSSPVVGEEGLAMEAALMHSLNTPPDQNIIWLRSFKSHHKQGLWRFYFEFAQWGDLYTLKNHYQAWNTYLPEEFLWQLFNSLAAAAIRLERGPFPDIDTSTYCGEKDLPIAIHFDLKPVNIFLAEPDGEQPSYYYSNYPCVKMADFGEAEVTGPKDVRNPQEFRESGTPGYRPPEQTAQTAGWERRPEGKTRIFDAGNHSNPEEHCRDLEMNDKQPGYQFGPAHNIWAIGFIMWEMLTLRDFADLGEEIERLTERQYWGLLQEEAILEVETTQVPEYSDDLLVLIRECLRISPQRRPTASDIFERTKKALVDSNQTVQQGDQPSKNGTRLYYRGHEINDMPRVCNPRRPIKYSKRRFWAFKDRAFRDRGLETLQDGRWQPRTQPSRERPDVKGEKKRPYDDDAFIFMRADDDPKRAVKRRLKISDLPDDEYSLFSTT